MYPFALALALALALAATGASAQVATVGAIGIGAPMLRATPPGAPVAAGYLTLSNAGPEDDALVGASVAAEVAEAVRLHAMAMSGDVMTMAEADGGIAIPAGETVALSPGGLHLMLLGLEAPLVAGGTVPVTLTFSRAGAVTLDVPIVSPGAIRAASGGAGDLAHGHAPVGGD